ncbi:MAG: glycosyltransferase family 2 protein [Burkholderiaceae bacterium]|jgi:GT2 family glycosyltransferase|nr:glycosyltransferase family 2 protein [Burkholderiaceae bacterium]
MKNNNSSITAIVVTYNRYALLECCIQALLTQSRTPDCILVIDNASTDGTQELLQKNGWLARPNVELLALEQNTGGAGGFAAGLQHALAQGADWVWMMDDDAEPHPSALEELIRVADQSTNVYGSLAVQGAETSWLTTVMEPPLGVVERADAVPASAVVQSLPFLGFLVHRDLVARIGLPDAGYFIAADDVEYCLRAQQAGAQIVVAGNSRIEHPKSRPYKVSVLGRSLTCLALPPWKRYYDTRNRLLIARKYYGVRLFTQTIPGSFVRLFAALLKEPRKLAQAHAFFAGLIDGLLGIKGRRHEKWGIR